MNKKLIVMETLIVLLLLTITSLSSMGTYESLVQLNTDNNKIDWVEQVKLNVSDSEEYDYFGLFVSISGNYALIGVFADDNLKGSAYIFKRDGTTWIQDQKLTASDGEENDLFGVSVSLDGDYALIGASSMNGVSGSAYVFKRYGTSWLEETKLTSEGISHYFGRSVSLDGNYALIGVPGDDAFKGSAYVFKRTGTTWNEEAKLTASDGEASDLFGCSVNINDDHALIGAVEYDLDAGKYGPGSAYVFKRDGTSWTEEAKLTASDGETSDGFGISVALNRNYAFVGSQWDDDNGEESGSVYVFKCSDNIWTEETKLTASDGKKYDQFGASVSLDGDYALIGAMMVVGYNGAAYVFKRTGTTWNEEAKLTASDGESGDWFGTSVSFNGGYALIGSPMDDTDRGSAYVFVKGDGNQPPDAPAIDGPTSLKINEEGDYTVSTTDLDGDKVYFYIDWDDGTIIDWDGPFLSDQNVHYKKGWIKKNTYIIRVKAQDIYGAESGWTELEVTVTRSKIATNNLMMRFLERFPLLNRLLPLLIK